MEIFYFCLAFLSLFLIFFISRHLIFRSETLNKIKPPSPPFALPIVGHLHLLKKPLYRSLSNLADRYGPVLFLQFGSRPVVVVSSPSAIEDCFTKNDIIFSNRPRLLVGKHLGYNYTNVLWAAYGPHWRNVRRLSAIEIFSTNRINMFTSIRNDEVISMVRELYRRGSELGFRKLELKQPLFELVLNVMMRMTTGKRYYGVDTNSEDAKRFREIVSESFLVTGTSNLPDFLPILRWVDFEGVEKRMERLQKKRDDFLQALIHKQRRIKDSSSSSHWEEGARNKILLDILLSLQESDPKYYTDENIKGIVVMMFTAGIDTSTTTMEWAMSLMLNHPEVLTHAKSEIDMNVKQGKILDDSDLPKLPYLHNIIDETLRLYPAAPLLVPRESSEECTIGGFHVPRGTMLLVNAWAMQRDPNIWADPTMFRPERFEGVGGEKEGYKFVPFGSGRRGCPAAALAMRMMALVLGVLIQCFEWERVGEEKVDMSEGAGITMPKAKPLEAHFRPRQTMINVLSQL